MKSKKSSQKVRKQYSREVMQRGSFGLILVLAVAGGFTLGGLFFPATRMVRGQNPPAKSELALVPAVESSPLPTVSAPENTVLPEEEPQSEPVPDIVPEFASLEPEAISLVILNGSGIDGEAGRWAQVARDKGFSSIATANAKRWDYEETEIYFGEDQAEKAKAVMQVLGADYAWVMNTLDLPDYEADIAIVIGQNSPM